MVVDSISHVLQSTFQIEKPTTYSTHKSPPSPPDYSMLTVADDLTHYSPVSPSFSFNSDFNDLLVNQPPPSTLPSEVSSALASEVTSPLVSDFDLPPLSSSKPTKQIDLHNFFSKTPSDEPHVKWQKRKQDNEDRDREEYAKRKQKDEAGKLKKLMVKRANNLISQKKRRDRLKKEKVELPTAGQVSSVSLLDYT